MQEEDGTIEYAKADHCISCSAIWIVKYSASFNLMWCD